MADVGLIQLTTVSTNPRKLRIFIQISDQSLPVLPSFLSSSSSSPSSPSPPPRFVSWLQVLQQIEDGEIACALRSAMYNLNSKTNTRDYLSAGITVLPRACDYLSDGKTNTRDYLSAGITVLPRVYLDGKTNVRSAMPISAAGILIRLKILVLSVGMRL
ncbi:hypothetical protein LXL04_024289 [Taraxacum kok-saghyz]